MGDSPLAMAKSIYQLLHNHTHLVLEHYNASHYFTWSTNPFFKHMVTRTTCSDKNNMHTQPTVIRSSINRFWFDRKRIYLRITVTLCKGIRNLGNFSLGIWNKGQVLWIPLITGIRNPSSTDKESRMQYPWRRIENPRLSDFLAWADHCFQLDKIKDIMCFHLFYFCNQKEIPQASIHQYVSFSFLRKETVYFPNVSVFSCILLPMK